jgi:flavin-dependent dehydrogenase
VTFTTQVAVVGGGPAGAATAALLARTGRDVVLLERSPTWRWRAAGVFASPAALRLVRRLGIQDVPPGLLARPVPAMRVELPDGPIARLSYGDDGSLTASAVGFDRGHLDHALLELAREAGVDVRTGVNVTGVHAPGVRRGPRISFRDQQRKGVVEPAIVVGADGIRSTVARQLGVARRARLGRRVGLTFHVADPRDDGVARDARMIVLDGAYCGLAPIPGGRVNVGIVLSGRHWLAELGRAGASEVARRVLDAVPAAADDPVSWAAAERLDPVAGAAPLGHRVVHRAGDWWLLVGDAAGFLDPFTGEGLHRALVSAELGAEAVDAHLAGHDGALAAYDRSMDRRFRTKDVVSLVVQAFLARPALFRYALSRLAAREALRETMGLVMGDLVPASRALDPRFLTALLRP